MDFARAETLALIAAYKARPIMYDKGAVGYHDRKAKAAAWKEIATVTGARTEECKAKMQSLLASYRKEKKKVSTKSNAPAWRYWNAFKFLRGLGDHEVDPLGTAPEKDDPRYDSPWSTSRMLARKVHNGPRTNATSVLGGEPDDEISQFGDYVDSKLDGMTETQRRYAEALIHQTLYDGLVFQLTGDSTIEKNV